MSGQPTSHRTVLTGRYTAPPLFMLLQIFHPPTHAEDDHVISIADKFVSSLFQFMVQLIQHDIC